MNDSEMFNFLKGFTLKKETKEYIIKKYLDGRITKEEYFKRMRELK